MYPRFENTSWITPYGLALVSACALCFWLTRRRAGAASWDVSHIDFALPLAFVVGALGAKLLAVLFFDRLLLFALLICAIPVLWIYCRRAGLSFLQLGDLLAPPLLLWLAVLRIGCFFAGCCWGDMVNAPGLLTDAQRLQVDTLPWVNGLLAFTGMSFPAGSFAAEQHTALGMISSASQSRPVLPTQLFESILLIGLYCLLMRFERTTHVVGTMLFGTLAAYAALRFALEFLRADNAPVLGAFTGNQLVCIVLLGIAASRLFVRRSA